MAINDDYRVQMFGKFNQGAQETLTTFWYKMVADIPGADEWDVPELLTLLFREHVMTPLLDYFSDKFDVWKVDAINWAYKQFNFSNPTVNSGVVSGEAMPNFVSYNVYSPSAEVGKRPFRFSIPAVPASLVDDNSLNLTPVQITTFQDALDAQLQHDDSIVVNFVPIKVRNVATYDDPVVDWQWQLQSALRDNVGSMNTRKIGRGQ